MKQYSFPDNRIWKAAFGAFLAAMLFLARDSLVTTAILGFNRAQFLMLGLICAAGIVFLAVNWREKKRILCDRRMLAVLFFAVVLLLPMVVKRDWQLMYFSVLLCLIFAVFLTYFTSIKVVAKYYVAILAVLGLYSVIATYLMRIPVDAGLVSVPVFYNSMDVKFHNFGLAFVSDSFVKNRNFGIFREPGVYQFFILLALYLNNYVVSWDKARKLWIVNGVLAVTMLSTFATGGIIELGLLAVMTFFDKKWYKDRKIRAAAITLAALLAVVLAVCIVQKNELYWELYSMTVDKFSGKTESMSERVEAVLVDLRFFLSSPLFGEKIAAVLHSVANNTTSSMILFAVLGIAGGLLHVAAWAALVWEKDRNVLGNLALLGILFMSFNTQNLIADVFFWLFPIMALVERGLPLLKFKKKG